MRLVLFVLPLALDTFAVSAALGVAGVPAARRLRLSLTLSAFELAMPIVGLLIGRGVGSAIGGVADDIAAGLLLAVGLYLLAEADEEIRDAHGLALLALGLSVSLDELAIGFSFGLVRASLVWALVLIAVQAFVAAQLGLRLGARIGRSAGRLAGVALIALGVLVLVD